jgi:hypothetical protein
VNLISLGLFLYQQDQISFIFEMKWASESCHASCLESHFSTYQSHLFAYNCYDLNDSRRLSCFRSWSSKSSWVIWMFRGWNQFWGSSQKCFLRDESFCRPEVFTSQYGREELFKERSIPSHNSGNFRFFLCAIGRVDFDNDLRLASCGFSSIQVEVWDIKKRLGSSKNLRGYY